MQYVYERHIKRQIENKQRFLFIQISLNVTNLDGKKDYKGVCPMNN